MYKVGSAAVHCSLFQTVRIYLQVHCPRDRCVWRATLSSAGLVLGGQTPMSESRLLARFGREGEALGVEGELPRIHQKGTGEARTEFESSHLLGFSSFVYPRQTRIS